MDKVEFILEALTESARMMVYEHIVTIESAYQQTTALIASKTELPAAFIRAPNPEIWGQRVVVSALRGLETPDIEEIYERARILASRLPGSTKVPSGEDEQQAYAEPMSYRLAGDTKVSSGEDE